MLLFDPVWQPVTEVTDSLRIEKKFKLGDDTFDRVAVLLHMPNKDKHSFIHSFIHSLTICINSDQFESI